MLTHHPPSLQEQIPRYWTDVAVLLSIHLAGDEGATNSSIDRCVDFLAKTRITDVELYGSLYRLLCGGYICVDDGRCFAHEQVIERCKRIPEGSDVEQAQQAVADFLNIEDPYAADPPAVPYQDLL